MSSASIGSFFCATLKVRLDAHFDARAKLHFGLAGTAQIVLHGVGGRTVQKLRKYDFGVVERIGPAIVILELGTNDLSYRCCALRQLVPR